MIHPTCQSSSLGNFKAKVIAKEPQVTSSVGWRLGMVADTSEPKDHELRALCLVCGQIRSKKVSVRDVFEEVEEMAFLLEITSSHKHKRMDQWEVVWEEVN